MTTTAQISHPNVCTMSTKGRVSIRVRSMPLAGLVACAALAIALTTFWKRPPWQWSSNMAWQQLIDGSADAGRYVEPRLTGGFSWAPLQKASPADGRSGKLRLAAIAGRIERDFRMSSSPADLHATAIGSLLGGNAERAVALLEHLAAGGNDPKACSDLAAARYVLAATNDSPFDLTRALASADCAVRLDARLPEGLFNRALILERLGLRDAARKGWEDYLAVEPVSRWAAEARERASRLQPEPFFEDELACAYDQLMHDPAAAGALAKRHPQEARSTGETEILAQWAMAMREGDEAAASNHLSVAREIGSALAHDGGDGMLRDLVASIDRADRSARQALITAHLKYAEGRDAYRRLKQPAQARSLFLEAEEAFRDGRSPGARLAGYFAANVLHPLGRAEESRGALEQLLNTCPPAYRSHRGQVLWQLGLVHYSQSRWGDAIEALEKSVHLFDALGERAYAASIREILANAHDRIGDRGMAWSQRMLALREFGRHPSPRLLTTLTYVSRSAVKEEEWATASSLMALAADVSRQIDDKPVQVAMHLQRARLHLRMQQHDAARADLLDARGAMVYVTDPGYQSLFHTNAMTVEAALSDDPRSAVDLLTNGIEFHGSEGLRANLPELYLERGRAYRRMRDHHRATADFEAGIAELEAHRESLQKGEGRFRIFRDSEELFREAIELALDRHDPLLAFGYVERARARTLLEALGVEWQGVTPADLPDGASIVELFLGRDSIVTFVVDRRGVRVTRKKTDVPALRARAERLADAARTSNRAQLENAGREFHRDLIEPIEGWLPTHGTLVIIPDPRLPDVPFAAAIDATGRFLIERQPIVIAPSAAVYAALAGKSSSARRDRLLLVTGGAGDLEPLVAARSEADAIASYYREVNRLDPDDATANAFAAAAESADVIHFAGHGVRMRSGASYLVLGDGQAGDDGRLDLKEIASLRLDQVSLVSLAACSTNSGERIATEGTHSIGRAFLAAGARSVISTLWPIEDDQAARFFPVVHRHLAQGLTPAEALRAAQLEWIRRPDGLTSLWSGIQIVGNDGGRAIRR